MVPGRVVKATFFAPAVLSIGLGMASYEGYLFSLALHLQEHLGYSPLHTGVAFLPGAVAFAVASLGSRRLPGPASRLAAGAGLLVAAGGYAGLDHAPTGHRRGVRLRCHDHPLASAAAALATATELRKIPTIRDFTVHLASLFSFCLGPFGYFA